MTNARSYEQEERIAIIADGCNVSQDEAEVIYMMMVEDGIA